MDGGIGESLLLENVLQGAIVGGGLSALTGGDFLTGALTGGIGGGIKGFLPDFTKIFNPAGTAGTDIATSAVNQAAPSAANAITSQAGQAFMGYPSALLSPGAGIAGNIPAGTYGFTADGLSRATDAAITTPVAAQNPLTSVGTDTSTYSPTSAGNPAVPATSNIPYNPASPTSVNQLGTQAAQPVDYAKLIKENNLKAIGVTTQPNGPITGGNYALDGKIYSGAQVANLDKPPSFFQKYKWPLLLGGGALAYGMMNEKPTLPTIQQPNYRKFGLASNYTPLPNPTPVYPRFAEGGIAALAQGGRMGIDKVNVDFMHGDMFPMSQQQRSFYATPTQMPTSAQQTLASYEPKTNPLTGQSTANMADGGITSLGGYSDGGRMLRGPGDGMSDSIPGVIANKRPARLADGEFVVPADVVSHLGNGSTDAGAKQLYAMMDRVRQARTGKKVQGKQINPRKLMTA